VGRRLYSKQPTAAEAQQWGLTVAEASGPPVEVWPDNLLAVNTFIAVSTQWNVGPGGPLGLNYASLEAVMRMHQIPIESHREVLEGVRTIEDAALAEMRRQSETK
jgi:hypothetical protein